MIRILARRMRYIFWNSINQFVFWRNRIKLKSYNTLGKILIFNHGKVEIGKGLIINSGIKYNSIGGDQIFSINVGKDAILVIGDDFHCSNSAIFCQKKISIGNNVMIGGSCKIWDTDFHSLDFSKRGIKHLDIPISKEIVIGDNVFIGGGSIILKGVIIGDKSIIGAGSVVTKSVPEGEIWAGNPAKFIRTIDFD